jgi:hypothetical protein
MALPERSLPMTLPVSGKLLVLPPRRRAAAGQDPTIGPAEESEPPIRQPHFQVETRSPERVKLSEELAILNRPLEDEVEYYDEVPPRHGKWLLAVVTVLAAIAGAGYLLLAQRHRPDDNTTARSVQQGEQQASPVGTPLAPSAGTAVAPATVPENEPAPTRPPIAPVAAGPGAENSSSTSATPAKPEPEGDPSPSAAASRR